MEYNIFTYIFFFFVYGFIGWTIEEIIAAFKYGRLVNRGFINGPVNIMFGICMVIIVFDAHDLAEHAIFQFVICVAVTAVMQYVAGALLKRITGRRFWDYSDHKANIGGYVSLGSVAVWGGAAALCLWFVHPFVCILYTVIPYNVMKVIQIVIILLFFIDLFVTIAASLKWKTTGKLYGNVAKSINQTKNKIGKGIFGIVQRRMYKAFPELEKQDKSEAVGFGKPEGRVFAKGVCMDKLIWIFFISALVGDIVETIFVWATSGVIMSRSSLLYGPFSIVWGLGGAFATALLYPLSEKNDRFTFLGGFFLGGVYEYSCSVFTEKVFGTVFWDYSHLPFNINGRINLLYCFFWGIAAIVWVKLLYPAASRCIEKIRPVMGKVITYIIVVAMLLNMLISSAAVIRYVERNHGEGPSNRIEAFIDQIYKDSFIERVYPNMKMTD